MSNGEHANGGRGALTIVKVRPAYVQVADQLRDLVVRGELAPGQRLPVESELTTLFGVSRSTVREALRTLTSQNLVTTRRGANGGTFVEAPDPERMNSYLEATIGLMSGADALSVDEMLEARDLFEVPAAALAARRRTDEELAWLEDNLADHHDVDLGHNFEGNKDFHIAVVRASGNRLLETMATPVFSVLRTRFLRDNAPAEFWHSVAGDHQEIYAAIAARDEEAAGRAMKDHLGRLRTIYEQIDPVARRILETAEPLSDLHGH